MAALEVRLIGDDRVFREGHSAEAVIEVRGPNGGLVDRGLIGVNQPSKRLELGPPGPHEVRVTLPSGEILAHGFLHEDEPVPPLEFDLATISPRDHLQRTALVQGIPADTTGDLRSNALVSTWVRLWERRGSAWHPVPPPLDVGNCRWYPDSVQYRLRLDPNQYVVQVGGPAVPWRLVSLPASGQVDVVIRPLRTPSSHPLEVIPVSAKTAADELLGYMSRGAVLAAERLVKDHDDLATLLLDEKVDDPYAAAVGGYYLLRSGAPDERMRDWPANLADWMEWMSDGPIIRGWQLLRGAPPRDGETARKRFLQAVTRGLPVYTEGLRLLIDGLKVVARASAENDPDVLVCLDQIGRYGEATDWSRPVLTFEGAAPDQPDPAPRVGFPERRHGLVFLFEVTLSDLIDHGLLQPGASLEVQLETMTVRTSSPAGEMTVTQRGTMRDSEGRDHPAPEDALLSELGVPEGGWRWWQTSDGVQLARLRDRARCRPPATPSHKRDLPVEELGLTPRVENVLLLADIGTAGQLAEWTLPRLLSVPNLHEMDVIEIERALAAQDLSLQHPVPADLPKEVSLTGFPPLAAISGAFVRITRPNVPVIPESSRAPFDARFTRAGELPALHLTSNEWAAWAEFLPPALVSVEPQGLDLVVSTIVVSDIRAVDLTRPAVRRAFGIETHDLILRDYSRSQALAVEAESLGADGVLYPSRSVPEATNLVVFASAFTRARVIDSRLKVLRLEPEFVGLLTAEENLLQEFVRALNDGRLEKWLATLDDLPAHSADSFRELATGLRS
jgi:RES domain-containing protein